MGTPHSRVPPFIKGGGPDILGWGKKKGGGEFSEKKGENTIFQKMKLVIIKNIMLHGQLIFSKIIFYFGQFTLDK